MAFTIDGLDCRDEEKSAVYSFTIYFYHGEKALSEVITVKALDSPVTGEVVKNFLCACLTEIGVLGEDGQPKISIWGISDKGSNIVRNTAIPVLSVAV